ncbi:MAG TPA: proton-conducting transporter membrane subunit [Candidatus Limnocylindria bacterium]|jgi:hydrogenase-4 component F|nr:proton-conducting transporter membrane subunit [Candidatus Limnocylindria bacterium]
MIAAIAALPLVFALVATPLRDRRARRALRIVLAALAALAPTLAAPHLDTLARIFVTIVSILGFLATLSSLDLVAADENGGPFWSRISVYFVLLGAFWSAMLLVVVAQSFAMVWFGISATTLATAFLVGYAGDDAAIEAAWKYLVLCSLGIAVALAGVVLLAKAAIDAGIPPGHALAWETLATLRAHPSPLVHLATALMAVGFATKAGIAPLHAWLPDAHAKAPAPISALLSGVLVSCALYAVMRTVQAAQPWGDAAFLHALLTWLGAFSVLVAGVLMLVQRDLKRLLAYSTVEHAGIVVFALGVGGTLGVSAALLHVVAHAFSKSGAFFAAGLVLRERGKSAALWSADRAGRMLLLAFAALGGLPPFGLFCSELLVAGAALAAGAWRPLLVAGIGVAFAFAALAYAALQVDAGRERHALERRADAGETRLAALAAGAALTLATFAIVLPWTPLGATLAYAVRGLAR